MRNPSASTRQCQMQTTFCVLAAAAPWFGGWFRETHACLSPRHPSAHIKFCCASLHSNFKALLHFLKIILVIYVLNKFNTLRAHELCAIQTHSFGFKMH